MSRRSGLGRGLDALIPGGERPASGIEQIPLDAVVSNPRQPRTRFDPEELAELAESIRVHGMLQPLIVTQDETPGRYTLIAGERRLLAARQAGLTHAPALVREASEQSRLEMALIENVQRADLAPLELAEAYRQLAEDFDLSHEQIAARVGKSRVAVTNTLRLLKLPESVRQALTEGRISEGHARALLALPTPQAQAAALHTILTHELNVRQTEALVRRLTGERPPARPRPEPPPDVLDVQERLQSSLGTRVRLKRTRKGSGTIVIHFYSDEELEALIERLSG
ncbi:MAG: ParB/RepB/Spo0J family partition protein [Anaerolineales bacterium]|nr:ParB/RepB/Spo0J family partition protein [Anaerolineales bacterium]